MRNDEKWFIFVSRVLSVNNSMSSLVWAFIIRIKPQCAIDFRAAARAKLLGAQGLFLLFYHKNLHF